jgi:hypothetical protein
MVGTQTSCAHSRASAALRAHKLSKTKARCSSVIASVGEAIHGAANSKMDCFAAKPPQGQARQIQQTPPNAELGQ